MVNIYRVQNVLETYNQSGKYVNRGCVCPKKLNLMGDGVCWSWKSRSLS